MPITVLRAEKVALLQAASVAYAFTWDESPDSTAPLRHLHWGGPITEQDAIALAQVPPAETNRRHPTNTVAQPRAAAEEYPAWGVMRREESALAVELPDGVRMLSLAVAGVEQTEAPDGRPGLTISLQEQHYPLQVHLDHLLDEESGAITRSARIVNAGDEPVVINEAASASWPIPPVPAPQVRTVAGSYGAESRIHDAPLPFGRFTLESRSGISGHDAQPFMAIHQSASETDGAIWSVAVHWSGSYRLTAHLIDDQNLHLVGGVNPFDLRHELKAGAALDLPAMTGIYTGAGFDDLTYAWHRFERTHVLPRADELRPVHYNSWEAFFYGVDAAQQISLAPAVAELGVELFVIDDGWFRRRSSNTIGAGDWTPDPDRFPDGLGAVADAVHAAGMRFGIWFEPESVNPDSDLYREHPDWIYRWRPDDPPVSGQRHMLDLSRTEVQDYLIETLSSAIEEARVDYVKWDLNRPLTEPNSPAADAGEVWLTHVRGVYRVWDALRDRFPKLWLETCSSGGGRADLGALEHTHWSWPSDNTDPLDRLDIQRGYSMVHLPSTMSAWVTDSPGPLGRRDTPLRFRFHVAMTGLLAIGGDVREWTQEERALGAELVALYKEIRPLVQFGRLHRLDSPEPGFTDALIYVDDARDRGALFVFSRAVLHTGRRQVIRLRGLDPEASYLVRHTGSGDEATWSGSFLQNVGLTIALDGHYDSALLTIQRQDSDLGRAADRRLEP